MDSDDPALIADEILSAKWNMRIMRVLGDGPARFSGIRAKIPDVSAKILAGRLRGLEQAGIIIRTTLPPPGDCQVYQLTELGEAASPMMQEIDRWGLLLTRKRGSYRDATDHFQED